MCLFTLYIDREKLKLETKDRRREKPVTVFYRLCSFTPGGRNQWLEPGSLCRECVHIPIPIYFLPLVIQCQTSTGSNWFILSVYLSFSRAFFSSGLWWYRRLNISDKSKHEKKNMHFNSNKTFNKNLWSGGNTLELRPIWVHQAVNVQ